MNKYRILLIGVIILAMYGCASLSESECMQGNWRIIGLDDGTTGKLPTRLRQYQKDCSEYGVSPNLRDYQAGYDEGIKRYCTRNNGFNVGNAGHNYNGVCPEQLSSEFLAGYRAGHELNAARSQVASITRSLDSARNKKQKLKDDIIDGEADLVSDKTSSDERIKLLAHLKDYKIQVDDLEDEIIELEDELAAAERDYQRLKTHYGYY